MAEYFEIPSNPEFTEQVEKFKTTDMGHADTFNKRVEKLFKNELALRKAIEGTYQQASGYTDAAIARLIGGAPSTLDTLEEIAEAIGKNKDVVDALNAAIGSKANEKEFESHRTNDNIHVTASEKQMIGKIPETYQERIKEKSMSITTDEKGVAIITPTSSKEIVLSVYEKTGTNYCFFIPFIFGNYWRIYARYANKTEALSNATINITYSYYTV